MMPKGVEHFIVFFEGFSLATGCENSDDAERRYPRWYLVLPNDVTQYLSTFQPSKQAYVLLSITR